MSDSVTLWTVARQAPLPVRFSRREYWRGLPCPPPGDLPEPGVSCISSIASGFFTTEPLGKPLYVFSSVQSLSRVWLFVTPWTTAHQASLSITNCWSLPKPMSIESVMPSNHLLLCRPLLLPSIFPSLRVFANKSVLCIRWPKYWSFSFSVSLSNEY